VRVNFLIFLDLFPAFYCPHKNIYKEEDENDEEEADIKKLKLS